MGIVFAEITMSLDGFAAGPNIRVDNPLGDNGQRLHDWLFGSADEPADSVNRQVAAEYFAQTGAFIIGRRTFDVGIAEWGEDGTFGRPCFVLTHRPEAKLVKGSTTFTFTHDSIQNVLQQARAAAGDKNICIMGGASVQQQYLKAGLLDEFRLHLVPVLLGSGTRLFEQIEPETIHLEQTQVRTAAAVTHLTYQITRWNGRKT